jgi:hypothetical protein
MIAKVDGGGHSPEKSIVLLSGTVDAFVLWLSRFFELDDSACRKTKLLRSLSCRALAREDVEQISAIRSYYGIPRCRQM